jgi:uncharacterized protein (TIGR03435 family)
MRAVLLLLTGALALGAQTPAFEVASIEPNRSESGGSSIRRSAGRLRMENVPLRKLTLWAYGVPDDREYALAGPDWMATERFDIQATFPADTTPEQVRTMTQRLLAERFQLKLHSETRERPIYALVVAKGGPKIQAVEDGQARTSGAPGQFEATKITMLKFADMLARFTGQKVVDDTGLKGVYDFTLEWSPEQTKMPAPEDGVAAGPSGPSVFTALQEQLGLKLEGRRGPVDILVVDHMEKVPTAN